MTSHRGEPVLPAPCLEVVVAVSVCPLVLSHKMAPGVTYPHIPYWKTTRIRRWNNTFLEDTGERKSENVESEDFQFIHFYTAQTLHCTTNKNTTLTQPRHCVSCPSTASRPGPVGHHHHPGAGERGGLQQALPGLLRGHSDAQDGGEDQHLLPAGALRPGRVGVHRRRHPRGGHHDLPATADTGCAFPKHHLCWSSRRRRRRWRWHAPTGVHGQLAAKCHLDSLWGLRSTR